jgi:hypothetical protein
MRSAEFVLLAVTVSHVLGLLGAAVMQPMEAVRFDGHAVVAQSDDLPRFEDYPTLSTFRGLSAPARIDSTKYGRMFRTRLREGARRGPNFAGAFTVVMWGCGSNCQYVAVVDARTGQLSQQTLLTANGVEYRIGSRLLIADPVRPSDPPRGQCASCGTEAAYVWDSSRFVPVGKGPHPHLSGGRPWQTP